MTTDFHIFFAFGYKLSRTLPLESLRPRTFAQNSRVLTNTDAQTRTPPPFAITRTYAYDALITPAPTHAHFQARAAGAESPVG